MQPTRRCWAVAGTGLVLVALGVAAAQPIAFVGAVGLGAYLIGHAAAFTLAAVRVDDTLAVSLTPSRTHVEVNRPVECAVTAAASTPLPCSVTLDVRLPTPLNDRSGTQRIRLDAGETAGETALEVEPAVAGRTTIGPVTLELGDDAGLFTETVSTDTAVALTVEPASSDRVHVGQGGSEIAAAYGEHPSGRTGAGLTPAELREYVPGDAADRIDWKATARLGSPYVREFEAETDRRTVLLVDARSRLAGDGRGDGPFGAIRAVALAVAANAEALGDPLGLYAVGDEGLVHRTAPNSSPRAYREIRESLQRLEPTPPEPRDSERTDSLPPATARRWADRLDTDDRFARTLRPYVAASDPYVQRIADDPLFETVRSELSRLRGETWTVLVTDDTDRPRLRESVKLASRGGDHVLAFIAPGSVYAGGEGSRTQRRDAFVDFEEFRRELDRLPRVSAFEIGPATRVEAMLARASRREVSR
jgi:uncharacterized protein (DUF58 family)